ncbi:unnamed protein product [Ilex paraguariensis]
MTRKKVTLAYIPNDSERKASFKKRKKGMMKKVNELSTLCGVDACAIVLSPYSHDPEVWPSPLGVQRVIAKFKNLPDWDQGRKMANQESFTKERIRKTEEKLRKQHKENQHKEMTNVMFQCLAGEWSRSFSFYGLNEMGWFVDQNIREIARRINSLKEEILPHQGMTMRHGMSSAEIVADTQIASEMPMNAMQNYQWNMQPTVSPYGLGWDPTIPSYGYNSNSIGPNFTYP